MHCVTILVKVIFFSDQCRSLLFSPAEKFTGKRLINHVINVADVLEEGLCRTVCYIEPNCVSYNFKMAASPTGHYKCELNNSTHEGHENELEENPIYVYHGTKVRNIYCMSQNLNLNFLSFSPIIRLLVS